MRIPQKWSTRATFDFLRFRRVLRTRGSSVAEVSSFGGNRVRAYRTRAYRIVRLSANVIPRGAEARPRCNGKSPAELSSTSPSACPPKLRLGREDEAHTGSDF
jgi:hypothetical protein